MKTQTEEKTMAMMKLPTQWTNQWDQTHDLQAITRENIEELVFGEGLVDGRMVDNSFDHEFGTETQIDFEMDGPQELEMTLFEGTGFDFGEALAAVARFADESSTIYYTFEYTTKRRGRYYDRSEEIDVDVKIVEAVFETRDAPEWADHDREVQADIKLIFV
jgi:hypothetical protein